MADITMAQVDYSAVVAIYETLKNSELSTNSTLQPLLNELKDILNRTDVANTLTRYYLSVKWYDLTANPADHENYPPELEEKLHSYTAFTKQYVIDFVESQTNRYANILVTDDPSGNVGWKDLDTFFG